MKPLRASNIINFENIFIKQTKSMRDKTEVKGGCMCGKTRYTLTTQPTYSTMCHCSDCRHAAGSPSVAWVTVPVEHFSFSQGDPKVYESSPKVLRSFCSTCGTSLTYRHLEQSSGIDITTASLDDPELFPPTQDIFCQEKLSWEKLITDNTDL